MANACLEQAHVRVVLDSNVATRRPIEHESHRAAAADGCGSGPWGLNRITGLERGGAREAEIVFSEKNIDKFCV